MKLEAVNAHASNGVEAFSTKDVSQLLNCCEVPRSAYRFFICFFLRHGKHYLTFDKSTPLN
jgi:hypothetical protein